MLVKRDIKVNPVRNSAGYCDYLNLLCDFAFGYELRSKLKFFKISNGVKYLSRDKPKSGKDLVNKISFSWLRFR
mgnify:CR=1 FL=1